VTPSPSETTRSGRSGPHAAVRLHVVTGKGGTGKTTVASALATALVGMGRRVLLAEVEGRQGISQTFDVPPLSHEEVRILHDPSGGELYGLSVEAKPALMEYLHKFYKLGRAGSVLERVGAVDFATTIAPGVRDVLLIGKVYEAVGRPAGGRGGQRSGPAYDAVVLDAPPTGRIVRFLNVNAEVADLARMGPIRQQADSITRMLRSHVTAVHLVTLLEEMPVQETLEAVTSLKESDLPVGAIVINQVRDALLDEAAMRTIASGRTGQLVRSVRSDLAAAGVDPTRDVVDGLLVEASAHVRRVALQREQEAELLEQERAIYRLPELAEGIEAGGIQVLADELAAQGMV
jgi:anion-transporting  ArsA/GET3 family ATPase